MPGFVDAMDLGEELGGALKAPNVICAEGGLHDLPDGVGEHMVDFEKLPEVLNTAAPPFGTTTPATLGGDAELLEDLCRGLDTGAAPSTPSRMCTSRHRSR